MTPIQIGLLVFVCFFVAVIAFVRGADSRVDQRFEEIQQRKKRIQWPASN